MLCFGILSGGNGDIKFYLFFVRYLYDRIDCRYVWQFNALLFIIYKVAES